MAFKASNQLPENGYRAAKETALRIKNYLQRRVIEFGEPTNADVVVSTYRDMMRWKADLTAIRLVPGIAQYAKDQEDDQSYDVAAEFTSMLDSITALTDSIESIYPKDGTGYLLDRKLDGSFREFTVNQLSSLITPMNTVINNIS